MNSPREDGRVSHDVDELGFEPAVSATGADPERSTPRPKRARNRLRRRVASGMALLVALGAVGGVYTVFAGSSGANDSGTNQQDVEAGRQLFNTACITCHGANLQGVPGRGPSLIGVGSAAVYFQVSTGRMPASAQGGSMPRKTSRFDQQQIDQLGAFVESLGGGPQVPTGDLRVPDSQLAEGGELFRLNCAGCHGATGKGAPLSAGKSAPGLRNASDQQIYTAMLTGPGNMPVFSDNQLTPDQKKAILSYIQTLKASKDPGGNGLDRIGPVSEGLVVWILGIGALMIVILWIGAKT
ncbi:MAG TPA: c-type cytochrome [Jatrophihabitantaceae bacterium]|nr:c-type cytochrome [Jatrophihabitantaceae bacterium]